MGKKKKLRFGALGDTGWYVREWLAHKNLRQADIVSRTDYNKSQVSEWVNGGERWNRDVLYAFAYAIGVEPADLLRPPNPPVNEIAAYVMRLDSQKRAIAIKFLKSLQDEDEYGAPRKIIA